ncbi:MAG: hypothetical protein RIC14_16825 [Filomicrobium sp.]
MRVVKLIGCVAAALLSATAALAADETSPKLERPAELIVIGDGEIVDALERAVDEQVAIINGDGGVMGQPLKVIRLACEPDNGEDQVARAKRVASQKPIVVFQDGGCAGTSNEMVRPFVESNTLFMGVGRWASWLTSSRLGSTIFRLGPRYDRVAQEVAFELAAAGQDTIGFLPSENTGRISAVKSELGKGFVETSKWGALLEDKPKKLISGPELFTKLSEEVNPLLFVGGAMESGSVTVRDFVEAGWRGRAIVMSEELSTSSVASGSEKGREGQIDGNGFPEGVVIEQVMRRPTYIGEPPAGAKAYTAFHPDWVAGFWQVMKGVKYAQSLDGREIASSLGGAPFFKRAPWLMLQSRSRYVPLELRQRFNDNGDLRMSGYELKKIWPQ